MEDKLQELFKKYKSEYDDNIDYDTYKHYLHVNVITLITSA